MPNLIDKLEKVDNYFRTVEFYSFANVKELPQKSGVYCIYRGNEEIYVGITDNLLRRLNEKFINEFKIPLDKKANAKHHIGAYHIQKKYPNSVPIDYSFRYFVEDDLNLYSLYERYLICLYEETILNVK